MCGIAGFVTTADAAGRDENAAGRTLDSMLRSIQHRGPDAGGSWSTRLENGAGIWLGHRRLSIIDLSDAGAQPMLSACGRFTLSFNGEIYNFQTLRQRLSAEGVLPQLRGNSDTEILLAAIAAWGLAEALKQSRGMFALALYDRRTEVLSLARDAFGEKPLYFAELNGAFVFASELKALRVHPDWRFKVDHGAIADCLRYGYIPDDRTAFDGVSSLPPGAILETPAARAGASSSWSIHRWWDTISVAAEAHSARFKGSVDEATDRLEALLGNAVNQQLISDVPIGAMLSGGIDSSLICAIAQSQRKSAGASALQTFALGFKEKEFDESGYARAVAAHIGSNHHEIILSADDALELVDRMPTLYDQPFTDPSQLPTYLISAFARNSVTVALSGDGGDELFAGYDRYRGFEARCGGGLAPLKRVRRLASAWGKLVAHRATSGETSRRMKLSEKAFREPAPFASPAAAFDLFTLAYPASEMLMAKPSPERRDEILERIDAVDNAWSAAERQMEAGPLVDLVRYLPNDILVKVDRAAMAVTLEGRMPFLDVDVVRFALSLPDDIRRADGAPKGILRRVLARHVPRDLFERPKRGFAIPLGPWLKGPFRDRVSALLAPERLEAEGLFCPRRVDALWKAFLDGRSVPPHLIWMLFAITAQLEAAQRETPL